ncbi:MAG: hypothetical protein QW840_00380 [Candidatus Bathyarchaeia archaeon]
MPARKMRVELFDSEGNRYTIAFEGQITRDKAVRLLDFVELLGGVANNAGDGNANRESFIGEQTKFDRVRHIIQKNFPLTWFSSKEVQTAYEEEFKEPLGLSTAATYLARLADRGALLKTGPPNSLRYKLPQAIPPPQLKTQFK